MTNTRIGHSGISVKHIGATVVSLAATPLAYLLVIRPWHTRWGDTDEDVHRPLPGDELIPHPKTQSTRVITIRAAPGEVWPWPVQMGVERGGFYSYDRLENLLPMDLGISSADRIIPQWQNLRVGDIVPWNREEGLSVLAIEAPRMLVFGGRMNPITGRMVALDNPKPERYLDASWAFFLDDLGERTTRLIARARYDWEAHALISVGVWLILEQLTLSWSAR